MITTKTTLRVQKNKKNEVSTIWQPKVISKEMFIASILVLGRKVVFEHERKLMFRKSGSIHTFTMCELYFWNEFLKINYKPKLYL